MPKTACIFWYEFTYQTNNGLYLVKPIVQPRTTQVVYHALVSYIVFGTLLLKLTNVHTTHCVQNRKDGYTHISKYRQPHGSNTHCSKNKYSKLNS